MAVTLKDLRVKAGFETAKKFAEHMDVPVTTYTRYEQSPDKIPLKAAWTLADHFSCPIDMVVGRDLSDAGLELGEVQRYYNNLGSASKMLFNDFMGFLREREHDGSSEYETASAVMYERYAQRYESMFLQGAAYDVKLSSVMLFGSDDEIRDAFESFVSKNLEVARAEALASHREYTFGKLRDLLQEDEETCRLMDNGKVICSNPVNMESMNRIIEKNVSAQDGKIADKKEEVLRKIMEAYDANHGRRRAIAPVLTEMAE